MSLGAYFCSRDRPTDERLDARIQSIPGMIGPNLDPEHHRYLRLDLCGLLSFDTLSDDDARDLESDLELAGVELPWRPWRWWNARFKTPEQGQTTLGVILDDDGVLFEAPGQLVAGPVIAARLRLPLEYEF